MDLQKDKRQSRSLVKEMSTYTTGGKFNERPRYRHRGGIGVSYFIQFRARKRTDADASRKEISWLDPLRQSVLALDTVPAPQGPWRREIASEEKGRQSAAWRLVARMVGQGLPAPGRNASEKL
jgi:hypothetical protein